MEPAPVRRCANPGGISPWPNLTGGGLLTRILIVNDDPRACALLREVAAEFEAEVDCSRDGLHALETLRENPEYDLVLTDLNLPRLSGLQLLKVVNQDTRLPRIPMVAIASGAGPAEISDATAAGAVGFLPKPLTASGVRNILEEYLGVGLTAIV